jgi:hypothetical protein
VTYRKSQKISEIPENTYTFFNYLPDFFEFFDRTKQAEGEFDSPQNGVKNLL